MKKRKEYEPIPGSVSMMTFFFFIIVSSSAIDGSDPIQLPPRALVVDGEPRRRDETRRTTSIFILPRLDDDEEY